MDKPQVEIYVADEWNRPEQAVVRYKMAVGFHRSSWDWIGLYRVGAWGLLGLEGVGSTAQHCGVPSELPPTSEHGEGMELCPLPGIMMWSCFRRLRSSSSLFLLLRGPHRAPGHMWGVARQLSSPCVRQRGLSKRRAKGDGAEWGSHCPTHLCSPMYVCTGGLSAP